MSIDFGPQYYRQRRAYLSAQRSYDAQMPPEDRPIERECKVCGEIFETDDPKQLLCDKCLDKD